MRATGQKVIDTAERVQYQFDFAHETTRSIPVKLPLTKKRASKRRLSSQAIKKVPMNAPVETDPLLLSPTKSEEALAASILAKMKPEELKAFLDKHSDTFTKDIQTQVRVPAVDYYSVDPTVKKYIGLGLDVESTGVDKDLDEIIELAIVAFEFDAKGNIYSVKTVYSGFEEPTIHIPEPATKVNGITDEMVKGHRFDEAVINEQLSKASLIIAHNAEYDRHLMERRFPVAAEKHWACTMKDTDWDSEGITGKRLENILLKKGFFYDAHRAEGDVRAMIHMESLIMESTGEPVLSSLLDSVRQTTYHIYAHYAPFEKKDILKDNRDYIWFPHNDNKKRCWHREFSSFEIEDEIHYLREHIYGNTRDVFKVYEVGSLDRYSSRKGNLVEDITVLAPIKK